MDENQQKTLIQAVKAAGYMPRSYSGRFMFGRECMGFSCDDYAAALVDVAMELTDRKLINSVKSAAVDNLGRGWIVYFKDCKPPA